MKVKTWAAVCSLVVVAGVAGYWTVTRLTPQIQPDVAQAAKVLGADPARLQEAVDLVNKIEASKSLSDGDRKEVESLLASEVPTYRRYGIKAFQFGMGRSHPEEVESVCAKMLADADEHVRATAAMTLYQVAPEHWDRYASQVSGDPSQGMQAVANLVAAQRRAEPAGGAQHDQK